MFRMLSGMAAGVVEKIGTTYYEMTHVQYVGSYGYNMALIVGGVVWLAAIVGVIAFISSRHCDAMIYKLAMLFEKKRG